MVIKKPTKIANLCEIFLAGVLMSKKFSRYSQIGKNRVRKKMRLAGIFTVLIKGRLYPTKEKLFFSKGL